MQYSVDRMIFFFSHRFFLQIFPFGEGVYDILAQFADGAKSHHPRGDGESAESGQFLGVYHFAFQVEVQFFGKEFPQVAVNEKIGGVAADESAGVAHKGGFFAAGVCSQQGAQCGIVFGGLFQLVQGVGQDSALDFACRCRFRRWRFRSAVPVLSCPGRERRKG